MELRDIEYFAVVAEHGSIGRAAGALDMSQPALSKSLRRLEQSIRAKVVQRTAKGIELTAVGRALLAQVHRLRLTMDDISREAADLSEGRAGHLRIGTAPAFAYHLVPTACDTLRKESPKVTLKIVVGNRDARLTSLRNGELDLGVTTILPVRYEDLIEENLYDEEFLVYASANHRLAKRKQVTLADIAQERWATSASDDPPWQRLNEVFRKAGLTAPRIGVETTDLPFRHHTVAASDLLAFGSRDMARYAATRFHIRQLHVKDLSYTRSVSVIYRKEAYLPPVGRRFIEILKATAKEIAAEKA